MKRFNKYFRLQSQQLSRKAKLITLLIIMIVVASAILIVNQEVIHHRIYRSLGNTLREWVGRETNGIYMLQYDSMQISTFRKSITLQNIQLKFNDSIVNQVDLPQNVYEAQVPEIKLQISSIWNIIFNDKLEFSSIDIRDPSITILSYHSESTPTLSAESGNLYLKIEKYLDEFKLNEFKLYNGKVKYVKISDNERQEFIIDKIDVLVNNLTIDAAQQTTESDRVRVTLQKPSFLLADNLHKLEMDLLTLDSDFGIELTNVNLFPLYEKLKKADIDEINIYSFQIPQVKLEGVDFAAAYRENILSMERIYVPKPEITVDTHKNKVVANTPQNNIINLISNLFHKIETDIFILEDARFDFAIEINNKIQNIQSSNTTLKFRELSLDTLKNDQLSEVRYDAFDLAINDYQLVLPDSLHELTAESILYSSDSAQLTVNNLQLEPVNTSSSREQIKMQIPEIIFNGFNAQKSARDKNFTFNEIIISNPDVAYHSFASTDSSSGFQFNFRLPDNKIANIVSANQLKVEDINLHLIKNGIVKTTVNNGDINFYNILFNKSLPADSSDLFNSSTVIYNIPNLVVHSENADKFTIDGLTGNLTKSNLNIGYLSYEPSSKPFSIKSTGVTLKGADVRNILHEDVIHLDTLHVESATFIKSGNQVLPGDSKDAGPTSLEIKFFSIDEGKILLNNDKGFASNINGIHGYIRNLKLDQDVFSISGGKIYTGKLLVKSEKENMYIGASKAEIDNQNLVLYLPYVEPMSKGRASFTSMTASQAALVGFDINELLNRKRLNARQLKLLSVNFELQKKNTQNNEKNEKRSVFVDWDAILKDNLEEINIDRVIASGPEIAFETNGGNFESGNFEIELSNFSTNLDGRKHLLNSKNIRLKVENIAYSKDKTTLKVNDVALDENLRLITFNKVEISNESSEIKFPLIFAKRMDLKALAEENKLIGQELEIAGFKVYHKSSSTASADQDQESSIPLIHFDFVNAHHGLATFVNTDGEEFKINNIQGELTDFDTEKNQDKLLYAERLEAKAGTLTGLINNKLDLLVISNVAIKNSEVHIDHLYSKPKYDKMKYAYQIGHEADWMSVVMNDITFKAIDLKKLLSNDDALLINKIKIGSLDMDIFRDKKLPFLKERYVPLPQQQLRNLKLPVSIDTIQFTSANIHYEELGEQAFEPGELKFQDLNITIRNITNQPHKIDKNEKMTLEVNGEIEGTPLMANAVFELNSEKNNFTFSGKMGAGGLTKFNKILENNAFLRIEKGTSRGITFNMKANEEHAIGKMNFYYKNLKISMIDKKTNKTSGIDESVASFLANTFVINNNNPSLFVMKEGNIYFKRDHAKSIFNYWSKSFLSGVISSIGVKNHKKELKEALLEANEEE